MKTQLKITAIVFLFLGYGLLLVVMLGLFAFWSHWQNQSSVFSDFSYFQQSYYNYFSVYNVSPVRTILIAGIYVVIGHGLLKLQWWAGYVAFVFCLYNLFSFIQALLLGYYDVIVIFEILFAGYVLVILFGNKKIFQFQQKLKS
jgi:hypothetical protein